MIKKPEEYDGRATERFIRKICERIHHELEYNFHPEYRWKISCTLDSEDSKRFRRLNSDGKNAFYKRMSDAGWITEISYCGLTCKLTFTVWPKSMQVCLPPEPVNTSAPEKPKKKGWLRRVFSRKR